MKLTITWCGDKLIAVRRQVNKTFLATIGSGLCHITEFLWQMCKIIEKFLRFSWCVFLIF